MTPNVFAVSDLHIGHQDNAAFFDRLRPETDEDWLIVAGDVADHYEQILTALRRLRARFAEVIWVPGNHELWSPPRDAAQERGAHRYARLVADLQRLDVRTPEDPFLTWHGPEGPVVVAPLFVLYDYTFLPGETSSRDEALEVAKTAGIICTDEVLLHSDPYPSREAWCSARLSYSRSRLESIKHGTPTVLVNHYPLVRQPTQRLRFPEFALWCGTERTQDWPTRFGAKAVVYGHLHIPVTDHIDGIPHHEVSLGYPHEWDQPGALSRRMVRVLGRRQP